MSESPLSSDSSITLQPSRMPGPWEELEERRGRRMGDGRFSTGKKKTTTRNFVYLVGQIKFLPPREIEIEKLNLIMEKIKLRFFAQQSQ